MLLQITLFQIHAGLFALGLSLDHQSRMRNSNSSFNLDSVLNSPVPGIQSLRFVAFLAFVFVSFCGISDSIHILLVTSLPDLPFIIQQQKQKMQDLDLKITFHNIQSCPLAQYLIHFATHALCRCYSSNTDRKCHFDEWVCGYVNRLGFC